MGTLETPRKAKVLNLVYFNNTTHQKKINVSLNFLLIHLKKRIHAI